MNIKRMADKYRQQVTSTGKRAHLRLTNIAARDYCDYYEIDDACRYLRQWYLHLEKALGGGRDLKGLRLSWEALRLMKREFHGDRHTEIMDVDKEGLQDLADAALKQFGRFHKNLPELIEKSLRRSARESGIF